MKKTVIFLFAGAVLTHSLLAAAADGHSLVVREPYIPQSVDLGLACGEGFSSFSSYIVGEGYAGFQITSCGHHCFQYLDLSEKVAAQSGQTYYHTLAGWRFQKYFDGSSWGPYLRPFLGISHYLFPGQVTDLGSGGIALGSYYFLHPGADARFEIVQAFGPTNWTFLTVGIVFKFRNF